MSTAVRYFSRSGNTKLVADAIANGANVHAISVDKANAGLKSRVDVLFVGGALYAYGIDSYLKDFLKDIDPKMVGTAVVFSTSWVSKHALSVIKKSLTAKGINVEEETFYVKNKPTSEQLEEAKAFGKKYAK